MGVCFRGGAVRGACLGGVLLGAIPVYYKIHNLLRVIIVV